MSVAEIILFVSSNSAASAPCVEFLKTYQALFAGVRLAVVRLDTVAQRRQAMHGSDQIKVQVVPTLVVIYSDGNLGAYQGQEKTIAWLAAAAQQARAAAGAEDAEEELDEAAPVGPAEGAGPAESGGLYDSKRPPRAHAQRGTAQRAAAPAPALREPKGRGDGRRPSRRKKGRFKPQALHEEEPESGAGDAYELFDDPPADDGGGAPERAAQAAAATKAAASTGGPLSAHRPVGQSGMASVRDLAAQMEQQAGFR